MANEQNRQQLVEQLQRGQLALFIGADLPQEVTGLLSRADLARELARRRKLSESLSLAEVAQRVSQAVNRWEFIDFIRRELDTTGKPPQPFHRRIVELVKKHQVKTIITTAYDDLLELAFREVGVGINRVVRDADLQTANLSRLTLLKLYGDAQQPDTLVVTDSDHNALLRDRDREAVVNEAHCRSQDTHRHVADGVQSWASQHNAGQMPTLQCAAAVILFSCGINSPGMTTAPFSIKRLM